MINGGDVAIDNTIIHNHSMIIFISMLHFCNDGLSGGQRQLLSGAYAGVSGEWWLDLLLGGFEMMMRWWWWWDLLWWCCFAAAAAAAVIDTQVVGRWLWCCCCSACGAGAAVEVMAAVHLWEAKCCGCGRSIDRFCVAVGQIGENSTCPEYQFLHMYVDLNCCTGRLKKKTVGWGENSLCPAYWFLHM